MAKIVSFPSAQASDATDRELALDTRRSVIVEAPAGSGKTGLLVQRYLKLLGQRDAAQPEEILAITFTNKATAELQQRVLGHLQAAQHNFPLPVDASPFNQETRALAQAALRRSDELGWNLLSSPQRLNIRSIDSVCGLIANSLPLLSGSGGNRKPLPQAGALYRSAARSTVLQLGGSNSALDQALRTLLDHRNGNLANCESLLAEMLEARDQWGELITLDAAELYEAALDSVVRPRLERALEQIVCSGLSRALQAMPPRLLAELTALAARNAYAPGYNGGTSPLSICANKHEPPEAKAAHLDHWTALLGLVLKPSDGGWRAGFNKNHVGFEIEKADVAHLKGLIADFADDALREALHAVLQLPPARYPEDQWRVAKALFHILRHALVELKLLFAERGECDFTELALAAREVLRGAGDTAPEALDLALAAGGHLRHLLVDEMQDTNSGQYELIELLTRSWDGATQTLFLVGDPKQSIYLFREARVERFLRTMQEGRLGEIDLQALRLTTNFRSQAGLISGFNNDFSRLFPLPGDPSLRGGEAVDVPFVAAIADRPESLSGGMVWHTSVLGEEVFDKELKQVDDATLNHRAQEALSIRRTIEHRMDLKVLIGRQTPWRIAVLGRNRSHLSAVVAELKQDRGRGPVPFRAVELDPLRELQEVSDVFALTRALLHPADRVAWLAVLHAPWCGLGLADLLALTGDDLDSTVAHLVSTRRHQLSAKGQQLLDRISPTLTAAASTLGRTAFSVHVERTWRSLGGSEMLPPERQANVMNFFRVLRDMEAARIAPTADAIGARLSSLYAEPIAGAVSVELLTIHKAKGLEWDLVLVPGLERGSGSDDKVLLNWLELDGLTNDPGSAEASIVLAPIDAAGEETGKLGGWLSQLRARRDEAERRRLFYVACTRASEELHLFAAAKRKKDGTLSPGAASSLLAACWAVAEPHFAEVHIINVEEENALDLAAAADVIPLHKPSAPPTIQRLPLSFDPGARFAEAAAHRLDYPPALTLQRTPVFDRPEGSFAVRAFGNVVHRYLQVLAGRLADGTTPASLLDELPAWKERLTASLRGEGLATAVATREAVRALRALRLTLDDPTGRWILSPNTTAASESALSTSGLSLRVDRTFLAGDAPLSSTADVIWIVDFKTTDPGSREPIAFEATERAKYSAQLEAYATIRRTQSDGHLPIRLGLYYPLAPRLIHWTSKASDPAAYDNQ
jgi:ATP-dependent exoDNAse (exonuclease V) beta subunit